MKLSIQTETLFKYYGMEDTYRMIREAGFEAIDWNIDTAWDFDQVKQADRLEGLCIFERPMDEIRAHYARELEEIRNSGLTITQAHAPFECYAPGRPDILEYAISIYRKMILFLDEVGCRHLIIHGLTKNEQMDYLSPEEEEALNLHLYESLIPALQEAKQIKVCLENLPTDSMKLGRAFWIGCCSNPYVAAEWIDRLNAKAGRECFGICLDTGHLNVLRIPFHAYIPILGKRILCTHIHDNNQNSDSHLMPYSGSIFWKDFLAELKKVGYAGDLSFETCAQTSKNRVPRELTPVFLRTFFAIGSYFRSQLQ